MVFSELTPYSMYLAGNKTLDEDTVSYAVSALEANRNFYIRSYITFFITFLLEHNKHTEKNTNHKCILQ